MFQVDARDPGVNFFYAENFREGARGADIDGPDFPAAAFRSKRRVTYDFKAHQLN